jgi:hypothetical protein
MQLSEALLQIIDAVLSPSFIRGQLGEVIVLDFKHAEESFLRNI